MCLYFSHVLFYGEVFALEELLLLLLAHVQGSQAVLEQIYLTVMVVPLKQNIDSRGHFGATGTIFLQIAHREVVVIYLYFSIVFSLECEVFRDNMLFHKIEGAQWPFLIAFEEVQRVRPALIELLGDSSREQLETLYKHPLKLSLAVLWAFLEILTQFLDTRVLLVLVCIGIVKCFLLANRPVEVDVLLLQLVHRRINLGQEIVCIFEDHILCSEHILLQFAYVIAAENLLLKYFQVPKRHIKYDLVALLAT